MAGGKEKKRGNQKAAVPASPHSPLISRRGRKMVAAGVLASATGFWILSHSDPAGINWASFLSPIVILSGYLGVGIGILLRDPA